MPRNQRDENTVIVTPEDLYMDSSQLTANATETVTITNVAPAAVGTATIAKWLRINVDGTNYYIPMWT